VPPLLLNGFLLIGAITVEMECWVWLGTIAGASDHPGTAIRRYLQIPACNSSVVTESGERVASSLSPSRLSRTGVGRSAYLLAKYSAAVR
jgi:hypothetical protein